MQQLLQDYRFYDIFSATFKISDKCNLDCTYCYRENALNNKDELHHMPIDVIDQTLKSLLEYKNWLYRLHGWSKKPSLYFIWHGGEPLTIGLNRIHEILNLQKKYNEKGLDIFNSIQTNGTLISESLIKLFQKEHFGVGISIDGPKEVNKHRVYRNNTQSFYDTYQGIQILKKNNFPWSTISVITTESIGQEEAIFEFFMAEKPLEVDFTPAFFYETNISLSPSEYAQFMIKMFDLWVSEKNPPFNIRFFKDILYSIGFYNIQKESIICELSGKCHRNISIFTNGDVYSCECLNAKPSNKIGNIIDETFLEIVHSESFIALSKSTNAYHMDCQSCDVFSICKAGCYNRRLPNEDGKPCLDFYCDARKKIIHHIIDWTKNTLI